MKKISILFLCSLFIFSLTIAQEFYKLTYNFVPGKEIKYLEVIKVKSTQEMMGREMRVDTKMDVLRKINVDSVLENGNSILSVSIDSMRIEISSKEMDTVISTRDLATMKRIIEIDRLGNVVNKKKKDKATLGTMAMNEVADKFELHIFSDRDLKIGGKWETVLYDTTEVKGTKLLSKTKATYKVLKKENKLERNCLKVEYELETESEGRIDMFGQELYLESNVSSEGVFWYDIEKNLIVYEEADITDNTTLATTGQGNMIIPITQKTKYVRKLVE